MDKLQVKTGRYKVIFFKKKLISDKIGLILHFGTGLSLFLV